MDYISKNTLAKNIFNSFNYFIHPPRINSMEHTKSKFFRLRFLMCAYIKTNKIKKGNYTFLCAFTIHF